MGQLPRSTETGDAGRRPVVAAAEFLFPRDLDGCHAAFFLRRVHQVRILIGASALGASWFLPAGRPVRVILFTYVALVYLPWSIAITAAGRRWRPAFVRTAMLVGDIAVVAVVQLAVPVARYAALFGYILISGFYAHIGRLWTGVLVAAATAALTIGDQFTGHKLDPFTLAMFLAVLPATVLLVDGVSRARQAEADEREEEATKKIEELDEINTTFISTVSHELRTHLTAIEGYAGTLETHWEALSEEFRQKAVRRLAAKADELTRLVGQLLDFSRLEAGRIELQLKPSRVEGLARAVLARASQALAGHRVVVDIPVTLAALADEGAFDVVLENLLTNAAKYSPAGSEITITARDVGDEVVVNVRDEGVGIAPDQIDRVFERFYRVGDAPVEGTGIGLAIVKQYAEAQGGTVSVKSTPRLGSVFTFTMRPVPALVQRVGTSTIAG